MKKAVLLMAHGAPRNLDQVEEYVLHVRHGRPLEQSLMETIKARYKQVGGSPLLDWTARQAEALRTRIKTDYPDIEKVYVGMRHSEPFIDQTVEQMIFDGVESFLAICMAPQFSRLTVGAYQNELEQAIHGRNLHYALIPSYARHPIFIQALVERLRPLTDAHPDAFVIFTAHSLPERILHAGDPYDFEVKETATLVAFTASVDKWRFAYQSQGFTTEKWLEPKVESVIDDLRARDVPKVIICPIGFVCDNVEILYDIDIMYGEYARARGMELHRTESLNASSDFIELLASLTRKMLQ